MSCRKPPAGLSEDVNVGGSPKKEPDLRGAAILHQQRRLKQATQFVHKDSADLLPLDQLRRLGTSKDLQPHSVVQRRLLSGSPIKESSSPAQCLFSGTPSASDDVTPAERTDEGLSPVPNPDDRSAPNTTSEKTPGTTTGHGLLIACKVCAQDVSSKLCVERQEDLISRSCVEQLGLQPSAEPPGRVTVTIEVGKEKLTSSALIVDDSSAEFSLGLDTLVKLKCCIDLEHGVLKTPTQVTPFLAFRSEAFTVTHPGEP